MAKALRAGFHRMAHLVLPVPNPEAARALHEDTLERQRQVLGDNHPATQATSRSLETDIRQLRDKQRD